MKIYVIRESQEHRTSSDAKSEADGYTFYLALTKDAAQSKLNEIRSDIIEAFTETYGIKDAAPFEGYFTEISSWNITDDYPNCFKAQAKAGHYHMVEMLVDETID